MAEQQSDLVHPIAQDLSNTAAIEPPAETPRGTVSSDAWWYRFLPPTVGHGVWGPVLMRAWAERGIWLGLAAWLLALVGTNALADVTARTIGSIVLILAGLTAVLAWGSSLARPRWDYATSAPSSRGIGRAHWTNRYSVRIAAIVLVAVLVWVADILYIANPNETFGIAGWLWLLSMGLLIAATARWPQMAESEDALGLSFGAVREQWRAYRVEALIILALAVLSVTLRLWQLSEYPFAIHDDERLTALNALAAFGNGPYPSVFSTIWSGINLPALWFVAVATSLKIGGGTLAALRLPAALVGAATVVPFYGLLRETWGRTTAIVGAFLLAISAVAINFSRVSINNIVTPFFWTTCFFFLARGLRYRKPLDWALAGLAGGLGEYSYYGTHLLPFVLLIFSIFLLLRYPRQVRTSLGQIALLALGYVTAFGPLLAYYATKPGLYLGRGKDALIWDHFPRGGSDLQLMLATLKQPLITNLLAISTIPDNGSFYWAPLLFPAEAALLVLGVALLIRTCYQPIPFLLLISGLGTFFVGGTLVGGVPQLQHWVPAFPAIYAAMALPIGAWLQSVTAYPSPWPQRVGLAAVALGLGLLGWHNIDFYFRQYQVTRPEFEIRAEQSRWEAALGSEYRVRTVGHSWQDYNADFNRLLIQHQDGAPLENPTAELPLSPADGKGVAFVFFGDKERYLPAVRALYPGGRSGEVRSHAGIHLFYTYVLSPAQVKADEGITLKLTAAGTAACHWQGSVSGIGDIPISLRVPAHARWSGLLYVPRTAAYRLALVGPAARMQLDKHRGSLVGGNLSAGWHRIEVNAGVPAARLLHLILSEAGGSAREVPSAMLWPAALDLRTRSDGRSGATSSPGAATVSDGGCLTRSHLTPIPGNRIIPPRSARLGR